MPFVKGQKSFSTKGMKFYHKGDETKMFPDGQQPEGWVKGRSKKSKIESYEKRKATNLKKYGVENPFQSKEVKEKMKQSLIQKYGVDNISKSEYAKEKKKETTLSHYEVEYPAQSKEVQEKMKDTTLERYGVEYSFQSKEVRDKGKQTLIKKYGVDNISKSDYAKEKKKETALNHYEVEYPAQSKEVQEKMKDTVLSKYRTLYACNTPMCTSSKKNRNHSCSNNSFKDLLDTMKVNYVEEFPIDDIESGTSYRYDFKVGNYLIEIDSTAYHNSYKHPFNKPKDKFYHQKKSKFAYSHGFVCIHIFDWDNSEEVLSSILRGSLEISGFVEPRLFLYNSKDNKVIEYSDGLDVPRLLGEGYLPIYDDGVVLKDK